MKSNLVLKGKSDYKSRDIFKDYGEFISDFYKRVVDKGTNYTARPVDGEGFDFIRCYVDYGCTEIRLFTGISSKSEHEDSLSEVKYVESFFSRSKDIHYSVLSLSKELLSEYFTESISSSSARYLGVCVGNVNIVEIYTERMGLVGTLMFSIKVDFAKKGIPPKVQKKFYSELSKILVPSTKKKEINNIPMKIITI